MIRYKLQNVLVRDDQRTRDYTSMYVRTHSPLLFDGLGALFMPKHAQYGFDTYFGGCSTKKWNRYCSVSNFAVHIDAKGAFKVRLTYYANDMEYNIAARHTMRSESVDTKGERQEIVFEYPDDIALKSDMVSFEVVTEEDSVLYGAWYSSEIEEKKVKDVELAVIMPTFNKEEFVYANAFLFEDILKSDEPLSRHLQVLVIDNGSTIEKEKMPARDEIMCFTNPNFGGAGGFSRGMIEAKRLERSVTHLLVMDDDVSISPESLLRTYNLLRIVNDEYAEAFLSGAMISMQLQDHQVEDVGNIFDDGTFGAVKGWERCLSDLNHVVSNEAVRFNHSRQYAAFWFCCFPMSVIERQGLCMPFFVRGDDAEFGLREPGRRFMTMNGICVWHMSFGKSKFNVFNECYLAFRNMLIMKAINERVSDVSIYELYLHEIETELRKFNYGYAELMCDAIEDYLKGPAYLMNTPPDEILKEKGGEKPLTEEFDELPPSVSKIYESTPLSIIKKVMMKLTHNGQVRAQLHSSNTVGVMPNEFRLYLADKIYGKDEIWMINDDLVTGYKTRRNNEKYKELAKRIKTLDKKMRSENAQVAKEWKDAAQHLVSEEFWVNFLGLGD